MTDTPPAPQNHLAATGAAITALITMIALGAGWGASQLFHDAVLTKATLDGVTLFLNALPGIGSALLGVAASAVGIVRSWRHGKERSQLRSVVATQAIAEVTK